MVKVTGPVLSLAFSPLLRKPRRHYAATQTTPAPPPPNPHLIVVAGTVPPNPDCTGAYERIADEYGHPCWARLPNHDFKLGREPYGVYSIIRLADNVNVYPPYFHRIGSIPGAYHQHGGVWSGTPIASELVLTEAIVVFAGEEPPTPDSTGTYERIGDFNENAYYRRVPDNAFVLWFFQHLQLWIISPQTNFDESQNRWEREEGPVGEYTPVAEYSGTVIASGAI